MKVQAKNKFKTVKSSILGVVVGAIAITGIIGISNASSLGYQTEIGLGFTFNPSITVSISGNLSINELTPGNYADSNIVTIGVVTNAVNGYVLQATTGTNSTNSRLVNTENSNYYFTSLGTNETVTSMNNATDNTWGYSYSTDNGTTWISAPSVPGYSGLPQDANTTAAERGSGGKTLIDTNDSASNQSVKFKIGAKAASNQASGEYTNTVNFYAVTYPEPEPGPGPNPPTSCNTPVPDVTYMQDITPSNRAAVLSSLTTGSAYYLRDSRDEEPYCVAKLADGHLWLLDNLRLDLTNSMVQSAMYNGLDTKTDASYTTLGYLFNGGGTTSDRYPTAKLNNVAWTDNTQNYFSIPMMVSSGNCNDTAKCANDPESGKWTKDSTVTSYGNGSGKIGIYYNYCAASAGSYCFGNGIDYGISSGDATESICPKNWHIPSGGASNREYNYLYEVGYSSNQANFKAALSTPISGYFYSGLAFDHGNYGLFWASSRQDNNLMYGPYVRTSEVSVLDYDTRDYGYTVRCVADY